MTTQCQKFEALTIDLATKPGALAQVYNAFQEAKVNIRWAWAYEMGDGKAYATFWAKDTNKAKDVCKKLGKTPESRWACWAWGDDQLGSYAGWLNKIKAAGVNLTATDAFALDGKFGCLFFVEEKDFAKLCEACGC